MAVYKLTLSYDGTSYSGWQVQPNGISIQSLVQNACSTILRQKIDVTGAGRTDAGVHALGQTAHIMVEDLIDPSKLAYAMNALLPPDIRILAIEKMEDTFHARYSATGKIYRYRVATIQSPFNRLYSWYIPFKLDQAKLEAASNLLLGTHDFKGFANESHKGVASHDSIRTIRRIDIQPREGETILEFEADGFLYKMVRNIVGTLVDISRGSLEVQTITKVLESKTRSDAGQAAPPHGLFLVKVLYS